MNHKFKANLSYIIRSCLKKKSRNKIIFSNLRAEVVRLTLGITIPRISNTVIILMSVFVSASVIFVLKY